MERHVYLSNLQPTDHLSSTNTAIISGITVIYLIYQTFLYFNIAIPSPIDLLWNVLVYSIPEILLLDGEKRRELRANNMLSQTHVAKAEALSKAFASNAFLRSFTTPSMKRRASMFSAQDEPGTDAPPGLGNWDNSCYQNSVLQGLASLKSLRPYLNQPKLQQVDITKSTTGSLRETLSKLTDPTNNGGQLWTPATLKSMSSWQQQDAQEYFSKIMDDLDKEAAKLGVGKDVIGLEGAVEGHDTDATNEDESSSPRNPLDGLLAQRVACTRCGFSEGLSLIPFNCLTVSLGPDFAYSLGQCLNEYTKMEYINEVECAKCTLLRAEQQLRHMVPQAQPQNDGEAEIEKEVPKTLALPPEVRELVMKRLHAIQKAIEEDDFSEKTLNVNCQIPKKAHVSSTKTKQAVVGRAPQTLAVHINRSMFDEMTGMQRKNYASVRYPLTLNLGPWVLNNDCEDDTESSEPSLPRQSLLSFAGDEDGPRYRLQAVVTHYGRHENGHYICYRKHATLQNTKSEDETIKQFYPAEKWWRLSDEDVSSATEEDVLNQSGVFMLFYEREHAPLSPSTTNPQFSDVVEDIADSTTLNEKITHDEITVDISQDEELVSEEGSELSEQESMVTLEHSISASEESMIATDDEPTPDDQPGSSGSQDIDFKPCAPKDIPKSPTPPFMRTARGAQSSKQNERPFGGAIRQMAAT